MPPAFNLSQDQTLHIIENLICAHKITKKYLMVLLAPLTISRYERPHKLPKISFFKDRFAEYHSDEPAIVLLMRGLSTSNSNKFDFNKTPFSK